MVDALYLAAAFLAGVLAAAITYKLRSSAPESTESNEPAYPWTSADFLTVMARNEKKVFDSAIVSNCGAKEGTR